MIKFSLLTFFVIYSIASAASYRPIVTDPNYAHDKWETMPADIVKNFRAFTTSFDSDDDDVSLGIPEWVAYEIKPLLGPLGAGPSRPSKWIADPNITNVPTDNSYLHSKFDRGHMCMKQIAFRLGKDADWNTHTTINACPQFPPFNKGIWKSLEDKTSGWADNSGRSIWVICGPVVLKEIIIHMIGDEGKIPVAIPHAFYKIIVRESTDSNEPNKPEVLALLYPHHYLYVQKGPHEHTPYLTSVDHIEELTGLDFLTVLPDDIEKAVEKTAANELWN